MAIGTFDGVHLGHQKIIDAAIEGARTSNGLSVVLTFWPHPTTYIKPDLRTPTIMSAEVKAHFLEKRGVDIVVEEKLTKEFSNISAKDFIKLLKDTFPSLKTIYVNKKFRFGHNREGNLELLKKEGESLGFNISEQETVVHQGKIIDSSQIRKALIEGKIEDANELLGYPYYTTGMIVEKGKDNQQYPTLDIVWRPELKPKYGVYAIKARHGKKSKESKGIANYSIVNKSDPTLQIYLFDSNEWGPGDFLTVEWLHFIRPEKNFESTDSLHQQIKEDIEEAKNIFKYLF